MEKIKKEDYKKYCVEYNGEEYYLGDKIMYANGGLYDKDGKMVQHAEEVEIVALDVWDKCNWSNYRSKASIMISRVSKEGTYLNNLEEHDSVVYKKGAKKYNEWALFSEIKKIKGDEINE